MPRSQYKNYSFLKYPNIRLCRLCFDTPLLTTCDSSQPSELVEFKGDLWTKTDPQKMYMYPTAKKQTDLCYWHQKQRDIIEGKRRIGRES